ncbi:MAG: hypothetical protein NUW01_18180 [Gemmatimonadaceae bacterium]|nr:hypothetical protein [Gemmatimonadaceae bacterium]
MTVNREQIRQSMLDEDIVDGFYGTASAGTTTSLTDAGLLDVGVESPGRFGAYWLHRPAAAAAANFYRRIRGDGFNAQTGKLDIQGAIWTVAPLASADTGEYEIWPGDVHPAAVNRAISRALTTRCFSIQRDSVTTNGQTRYDIAASPFTLTSISSIQNQVLEINQVSGTDPNARIWPWASGGRSWWPEEDNNTLYLRFYPAPSGTLEIVWKKPYADLTDETTTSAVNEDYVKWAAFYELFFALENRAKAESESKVNYKDLKETCYARYWARNQMEMGRFASQYHHPRPRWRSAVAAPTSGRGYGGLGGYGAR